MTVAACADATLDVLLAATAEEIAEVEGMSERRSSELHLAISGAAAAARRKTGGRRV